MPPRRLADTQAPGSFAQDKDALEDILLLPISITPTSASSLTRMGIAYSLFLEAFPGKPRWSVEEISDLTGQVVIVTGGNSGIGIEMCKVLLSKGAKVYMTARSREKADEAIEWLRTETRGKSPVFLELDLADLNSVRRAVGEFKKNEQDLHVLYNNAGIMLPPVELKTANGYDLQFGTNVLGHYLFTTLLLPLLIHTARTSQLANGVARVVNTSSTMQWMAPRGGINYATLVPNSPEANEVCIKMGTGALHAQSKWGIIAFSNELARRYESQGIISMSLHPGAIANRYNSTMPGIGGWFVGLTLNPTHWGALTPLYGGTSLEGMNLSGKYLIPWGRIGVARSDTYDEKRGQELWSWLEEQVKRF